MTTTVQSNEGIISAVNKDAKSRVIERAAVEIELS